MMNVLSTEMNGLCSAPAIDERRIMYYINCVGDMKAVTDTGTLLWSKHLGSDYVFTGYNMITPAIASDNTIYVCAGGSIYAFHSRNGDVKWSFSDSNKMKCMSVTVALDNLIIAIGKSDAKYSGFNAFTNAGVFLWNTKNMFQSISSNSNTNGPNIVIGENGTIISSSSRGFVGAIARSGTSLWYKNISDNGDCINCYNAGVSYDPVTNTVYATGANSQYLWAINGATGSVIWQCLIAASSSSPAVGKLGIYTGNQPPSCTYYIHHFFNILILSSIILLLLSFLSSFYRSC